MNFQTNSEVLNVASSGYTQNSPMKVNQFVNQRKKFFANNQHQKQSEHIFGTQVQKQSGYGKEAQEVEGIETVKKTESHPIEEFWNDYRRKRQQVADGQQDEDQQPIQADPIRSSPASGEFQANLNGRYASQQRKQQMLQGNFGPAQMWSHLDDPHSQSRGAKAPSQKKHINVTKTEPVNRTSTNKSINEQLKQHVEAQNQQLQEGQSAQLEAAKMYELELQRQQQQPESHMQQLQPGLPQSQQILPSIRMDENGAPQPMNMYEMEPPRYNGIPNSNPGLAVPFGVSQSPRTQNMLTKMENPKFQNYETPADMEQQFPQTGNQQSQLSLEQARYMARMNVAALRQTETYKQNMQRVGTSEKERYAQNVEGQIGGTGAIYTGGGESQINQKSKIPLGKYVSQLEMKDPEARRRLKEMLEFQMKEKRQNDTNSSHSRMRIRQTRQANRPPVPQMGTQTLAPSQSAGILPPLNINMRSGSSQGMTQSLTPHRQNQGYLPSSQQQNMMQRQGGGVHSQSPLRGSGQMQVSQHNAGPAGVRGQRYNDLVHQGPGAKDMRAMVVNGMGNMPPKQLGNYNSQPQLQTLQF